MSMMKTVLKAAIFSVLFLSGGNLAAQVSPVRLGVRLGGGMSVNTGMDKILVPEDYYSNYSLKDKGSLLRLSECSHSIMLMVPSLVLKADSTIGRRHHSLSIMIIRS